MQIIVVTITAILCLAHNALAQQSSVGELRIELERLKASEGKLLNNLKTMQAELDSVRKKIEDIEIKIADEQMKGVESVRTVTIAQTNLFSEPSIFSDRYEKLNAGVEVHVLGYALDQDQSSAIPGWYKVRYKEIFAYVPETFLKMDVSLKQMKMMGSSPAQREELLQAERKQKEAEEEHKRKQLQWEEEANARKVRMLDKYGSITGDKIVRRQIWIGMTGAMLEDSMGKPSSVNRTVTESVVREQWIYDNTYIYLENGIVTAYQDHR